MKAFTTLRVNSRIVIPRSEFHFSFVRSSGPGGQNVNKVSSKAVLRWSVVKSRAIPDDVRGRFLARFFRRVNDSGELVLTSQRYRDQAKNVDDCLQKLRALVLAVASAPQQRKETRPSGSVREERLRQKHATAEKKQRRRPQLHDD
jgi:ribosome-associated protein